MNTLKSLAHAVHQALQPVTPCKRAHTYELIAALYGFKTYAALSATHLLNAVADSPRHHPDTLAAVERRCRDLGYPEAVVTAMRMAVVGVLEANQIGVMPLSTLIGLLTSLDDDEELPDDEVSDGWSDDEFPFRSPELLLSQLAERAEARRPEVHYGLSVLYCRLGARDGGSEYWWRQGQNEHALTSIQQAWADAYELARTYQARAVAHLQEAARLGYGPARIRLAEESGDVSILEESSGHTNISPRRMANLAFRLGRTAEAERWKTRGAAAGDLALMRELLENETGSLKERWVWVYFGQLMGEDLLAADYAAVHEDGSAYDDDVGGALYVTGNDAIGLSLLSDQEDQAARAEAVRLYEGWAATAEREGRVAAARLLPFWLARAAGAADRDGADDESGGSA